MECKKSKNIKIIVNSHNSKDCKKAFTKSSVSRTADQGSP